MFAVCDQKTSYNMDFMIYTRSVAGQDETSMTRAVVSNLCTGYELQGYCIFTNKFYSPPALLQDLGENGCDLAGTLRVNSAGVLQCLKKS